MTGWRDRLASLRVPYADVAPKVSHPVIYDIQTDMVRPATQDDIRKLEIIANSYGKMKEQVTIISAILKNLAAANKAP